jgi:hypothetical protein
MPRICRTRGGPGELLAPAGLTALLLALALPLALAWFPALAIGPPPETSDDLRPAALPATPDGTPPSRTGTAPPDPATGSGPPILVAMPSPGATLGPGAASAPARGSGVAPDPDPAAPGPGLVAPDTWYASRAYLAATTMALLDHL